MNRINSLLIIFSVIVFSTLAKTTVLFSPDDKPQKHLLSLIRNAQTRIHAAIYLLTDKAIAHELIHAKQDRGIDVQLVTDQTCLESNHNKISVLKPSNIDVFIFPSMKNRISGRAGTSGIMHHKFAIIDNTVWTGSFNWTKGAAFRNQENIVICDDESVVQRYENQFGTLKKRCVAKKRRSKKQAPAKSEPFRLGNLLSRIRKRWGY